MQPQNEPWPLHSHLSLLWPWVRFGGCADACRGSREIHSDSDTKPPRRKQREGDTFTIPSEVIGDRNGVTEGVAQQCTIHGGLGVCTLFVLIDTTVAAELLLSLGRRPCACFPPLRRCHVSMSECVMACLQSSMIVNPPPSIRIPDPSSLEPQRRSHWRMQRPLHMDCLALNPER